MKPLTVKKILEDMSPNQDHSIEVRKLHQIGDGHSPQCLLIGVVTNDCGFSDYPEGRLVLLSANVHANVTVGEAGRLFVRVKSIIGSTKRLDWMEQDIGGRNEKI